MHNRSPDNTGSHHPATTSQRTHSRLWGGVSVMGLLCLLGTFLISGGLFWLAAPDANQAPSLTSASAAPSAVAEVPLTHKKIQDIRPGQWVRAENPGEEDDLEFGSDVDPASWKLLTLTAPKLDGTTARVQLLRPQLWLSLQRTLVGEQVYISVPECGISGNATVLQIEDCPPLAPRPGPGFQIVTGTFQHAASQTLDISVEGESKPIGTTPNHPIWSVDRQAFVRADSLTVGERLQNLNGITTVKSISPRGPPEPVYNLEVQVKHTYYVADSGVLVHNGAGCPNPQKAKVNDIRWTHDDIKWRTRDGDTDLFTLSQLAEQGKLRDPVLDVVFKDGKLYSLNNRRLAAYKMSSLQDIPIRIRSLDDPFWSSKFRRSYTSYNDDGIIVKIRGTGDKTRTRMFIDLYGKIHKGQ